MNYLKVSLVLDEQENLFSMVKEIIWQKLLNIFFSLW
jgi:hypothetical protein